MIAILLACVACGGHGRRMQFSRRQVQSSPVTETLQPQRVVQTTPNLRPDQGVLEPGHSFATLLASCHPEAAFNPARAVAGSEKAKQQCRCFHERRDLITARRHGALVCLFDTDEAEAVSVTSSSFSSFAEETMKVTPGSKTFLIGVDIKQDKYKTLQNSWRVEDSLAELSRLAETAGLEVVGSDFQKMQHPSPASFIGKGKLQELAEKVASMGVESVVFDEELTVGQIKGVQDALGEHVQVIDRTYLTLFIFAQRASTREAKLQVAAAQMQYMLPRLQTFMTTGAGMDSKGGSSGGQYMKGKGETQLEMDRRLVREQISKIDREIADLKEKRETFRDKRRKKDQVTNVAVVGYTNAGKSTLVNQLSGRTDIYADDLLFATLDPTTRKVILPGGKEVILSDTVGFIQKLPTKLIASFRATLEELVDATVVVHVVDAHSPLAVQQVRSVQSIIAEEGASDIPQVLVLNKVDKLTEKPAVSEIVRKIDWATLHPGVTPSTVVEISALDGGGKDKLLQAIEGSLLKLSMKIDCILPWSEAALVAEVHKVGKMESEEYEETGTRIVAYVPQSLAGRIEVAATAFSEVA